MKLNIFYDLPKLSSARKIFIAIILGIFTGLLINDQTEIFNINILATIDFIGTIFTNALKLVVVPLVFSSIIIGVNEVSRNEISKLGAQTFVFFISTTLIAIILGFLVVTAIHPGIIADHSVVELNEQEHQKILDKSQHHDITDIFNVILKMIPPNIFLAAAQSQMLGLIFFSLLFGYFINSLRGKTKITMIHFWDGVLNIMVNLTLLILRFSPIGIYSLITKNIMHFNTELAVSVLLFLFAVLIALLLHLLLILFPMLHFIAKANIFSILSKTFATIITAFSTSSSAITLPICYENISKDCGVSNKLSSFILPIGSNLNMNGSGLYICMSVLFVAQAYNIPLSIDLILTVLSLSLIGSITVAGIPSASIIAIILILNTLGFPTEGIALIILTDRILDMFRTVINIFGDIVCTITIAHLNGEITKVKLNNIRERKD